MPSSSARPPKSSLDEVMASRFARIALSHVDREYPNKLDHVLTGPRDVRSPRALHPVFYGSFDWHSCVHSHWLLATLYRKYPRMPDASRIRRLFDGAFTAKKIAAECAYLKRAGTRSFERPYGWAWLLMLQAELNRHNTKEGILWASRLRPLAKLFAARFREYLPKATYPVRSGMHSNTAFALALAYEYAGVSDKTLAKLIRATARSWYGSDRDYRASEPSGEDFLSPALSEAECLRRIL